MTSRAVAWDGFHNARDLGGLPTRDGGATRTGAFVRSGDLRFVTPDGWAAARAAGVRTVLDLRNDDEVVRSPDVAPGFEQALVALDGIDDVELWRHIDVENLHGTPLYFTPFLARRGDRCAAVVTALARSAPGGVLFHCGAGRDRTGLISLLLLALADVEPDAIAADYALSAGPVAALVALTGAPDQQPAIERILAERGTTVHDAVLDILRDLDAHAYLQGAGVDEADLATLRERLRGPAADARTGDRPDGTDASPES